VIAVPKSVTGFVEGLVQDIITELTDRVVITPVGAVGITAARIPKVYE
jgi:hypothetical protein